MATATSTYPVSVGSQWLHGFDATITGPVGGVYTITSAADVTDAQLQEAVDLTAKEMSYSQNELDLRAKAEQGLALNKVFLGLANPTQAQVLAQVRLLTREANNLIRLQVSALDSTDDT
jgi:hypothetical protein